MRKKWLVLPMVALVMAGLVSSAAAQSWKAEDPGFKGQRFAHRDWKGKKVPDFGKRLSLSAEQKEKLANLKLTFKEETLDLRTELQKKKLEIQKLLLEKSSNLTRVYELVDEVAPIRAKIQKEMIEFWSEVKSLLTEEQLEKLPRFGFGWGRGKAMGHRGPATYHGCSR